MSHVEVMNYNKNKGHGKWALDECLLLIKTIKNAKNTEHVLSSVFFSHAAKRIDDCVPVGHLDWLLHLNCSAVLAGSPFFLLSRKLAW